MVLCWKFHLIFFISSYSDWWWECLKIRIHFLSYLNLLNYVNSCLMLRYIYCLRLVLVDNWYPLEYLKNSFAPVKGIYRLSTFIIKNLLSTNLNHMIFFGATVWKYSFKANALINLHIYVHTCPSTAFALPFFKYHAFSIYYCFWRVFFCHYPSVKACQ